VSDQLLWFASRGSGVVSLILLTIVTVLGLLGAARWKADWWPRFLTIELHNNLALIAVMFVAVHVVAAIIDPFTSLGISAATIPFASTYRPLWVGLGVISVYLFIAMIVTSMLRERVGRRLWRAVHWAAYLGWPLAFMHGLGAGSDSFSLWLLPIELACALAVGAALTWRWRTVRLARVPLDTVVARTRTSPAPYAAGSVGAPDSALSRGQRR
jgi:sulfoxide reductase heme-binding subunit YedZ